MTAIYLFSSILSIADCYPPYYIDPNDTHCRDWQVIIQNVLQYGQTWVCDQGVPGDPCVDGNWVLSGLPNQWSMGVWYVYLPDNWAVTPAKWVPVNPGDEIQQVIEMTQGPPTPTYWVYYSDQNSGKNWENTFETNGTPMIAAQPSVIESPSFPGCPWLPADAYMAFTNVATYEAGPNWYNYNQVATDPSTWLTNVASNPQFDCGWYSQTGNGGSWNNYAIEYWITCSQSCTPYSGTGCSGCQKDTDCCDYGNGGACDLNASACCLGFGAPCSDGSAVCCGSCVNGVCE